jgi:hypothetical protein
MLDLTHLGARWIYSLRKWFILIHFAVFIANIDHERRTWTKLDWQNANFA